MNCDFNKLTGKQMTRTNGLDQKFIDSDSKEAVLTCEGRWKLMTIFCTNIESLFYSISYQ